VRVRVVPKRIFASNIWRTYTAYIYGVYRRILGVYVYMAKVNN
jgi:hypothetical protein